jgi:protein-tyrosine phosphatase
MAAAYWIGKGLSAKEAIEKVRKSRPHAVETKEQKESLKNLGKSLLP